MKLKINHSFKTNAEITNRTIMVAEAFGLGIDETKEFPLYKDIELDINDNDIIYITGDSGSGKSWLLKNVFKKLSNTISFSDLKIDDDEIIVEGIGKDLNDALKKLNIAGLGDAFLYLRKYKHLSDGQKYRYKIAKFIDMNKDIWILDEFCFGKNTLIFTSKGIKYIKDIKIGDKVLSHDGKYHLVINKLERNHKTETMFKVGYRNYYIEITNNHPCFVKSAYLPRYNNKWNIHLLRKKSKNTCPQWIPAGKIEKADCLGYPLLPNHNNYQTIKINSIIKNSIVEKNCIFYGKKRNPKSLKIPNEIILDEKLAKILGYYVAEGSQGIRFSFNINEKKYIDKIQKIILDKFNINPSYKRKNTKTNTYILSYHSKILTELFEKLCGRTAKNKKIPNFIFKSPKSVMLEFIKGWYLGDGCIKESRATTISQKLAEELFLLGLNVNIICSINKYPRKESQIFKRKLKANTSSVYQINLSTNNKTIARHLQIKYTKTFRDGFYDDNYFWVYVTDVYKKSTKTKVYNLTVNKTNTYVTSHGLVHNCATLDRTTAKIVAYNIQKIARKLGKMVVVATTHIDLLNALKPDIYISKGYEADIEIKRFKLSDFPEKLDDIYKQIKITKGTIEDYEKLERFHYRNAKVGAVRNVIKMTFNEEIIGVIVITYPHLCLKGRNIFNNGKYAKMTKENCKKINEEYSCISRIILHPKYRGIGLSYYMLKEYFKKFADTKYIETVAVMSRFNPFFEKAGMKRIETDSDKKRRERIEQLEQYGFNPALLSSARYNEQVFNKLNETQKTEVIVIVKEILNRYKGQIVKLFSKNKSIDDIIKTDLFKVMKELPRPETLYWIWERKEK